jgi:hypothetical protein
MAFVCPRGLAGVLLVLSVASPVAAQYGRRAPAGPVGEQYRVEFGAFLWQPTPEIVVESALGDIAGTRIDLVSDLGIEEGNLPEFRAVLRPARKHKLRVSYVPIHYAAEATVERTFAFNGTIFRVGVPVASDYEWKAWRFGYEYDFVSRERGFVGLIAEVKYTDVKLDLDSNGLEESASARVPVPAVGGIFRVYPASLVSITGEVTGMKLPGSLTEGDETAHYLDWDLYATVNATPNIGVQAGYRTLDLSYRTSEDFGEFRVEGWYFGAVVRF